MVTPLVASDSVIYSMSLTGLLYVAIYVQDCKYIQSLYEQIVQL